MGELEEEVLEVVWNGGPLLPEREQKPQSELPKSLEKRLYRKTGRHIGEFKGRKRKGEDGDIEA